MADDRDGGAAPRTVERLAAAGVRAAVLALVDCSGVARVKCVPLDRLAQATSRGVGFSAIMGGVQSDDHFAPVPGIDGPMGDIRLVGDAQAAMPLACSTGWVWLPVDMRDQEGAPWPYCPRSFLRRMIARAAERGLELQAGWELEWIMGFDEDGALRPLHGGPGYGAVRLAGLAPYLLALLDTAAAAGIAIDQCHPEYAPGQVEASLAPRDPLRACDEVVLLRHIARTLAEQAGWRASFSPLVSRELLGNGAHAHFSVWRDGINQFSGGQGPAGLRPLGEAFLAGVLDHLIPLTALAAPSPVSYLRLQPSHWAGAYACWGHENREAALRLEGAVGPAAGRSANVEWKSVDGAANPYLVLGGLIAAGLDGVVRGLRLPEPVTGDPARLSDEQRRAGRIERLPVDLAAAADALAFSALLREAMGESLHDCVIYVRRGEAAGAAGLDDDALCDAHRWRY